MGHSRPRRRSLRRTDRDALRHHVPETCNQRRARGAVGGFVSASWAAGIVVRMKPIFEGKHVLVFDRDGWEFVERKSAKEAVGIIAITDRNELILVEQYRKPLQVSVIDLPAGLIGDEGDHDPRSTAKGELKKRPATRAMASISSRNARPRPALRQSRSRSRARME